MNTKAIATLTAATLLGIGVALSLLVIRPSITAAHDGEHEKQAQAVTDPKNTDDKKSETKQNSSTNTDKKPAATNAQAQNTTAQARYSYTAQPGDSYSKLARKAIQTYGINNKVNLSLGRIMYAETLMTQQAGSPELTVGQKVDIQESTVKSWVDKARALSNDQAAKWDKYTVGVNFNTNNVGETR